MPHPFLKMIVAGIALSHSCGAALGDPSSGLRLLPASPARNAGAEALPE